MCGFSVVLVVECEAKFIGLNAVDKRTFGCVINILWDLIQNELYKTHNNR